MTIEATAPTRVDLAVGTIDIWPLYLFHPGATTVNFAVSLNATCRIEPRPDDQIILESRDRGVTFETSLSAVGDPPRGGRAGRVGALPPASASALKRFCSATVPPRRSSSSWRQGSPTRVPAPPP